ncbi:SRPBCC family protein [Nocardia fluminea]|uniref:SRPBCC family protein n=1 Tax=Nocardia fluminea TaxID=134984 RepID=UPI00340672E9
MSEAFSTGWTISETVDVSARPETIYSLVSDVARMGEWSPECYGGAWISGTSGRPGARFHGYNRDRDAFWVSESEVVEAEIGSIFTFSVLRFRPGGPLDDLAWTGGSEIGDMTWSFQITDGGDTSVLTQRHHMKSPSPFYRAMLEGLDETERLASMEARREELHRAMALTLARIRTAAECAERPAGARP